MKAANSSAERLPRLSFTRIFDAPRELVFRVWTEPAHIRRWWGPHDFSVPHAEFDARPGGRLRIDFRGPDGVTFPNVGEVREVTPPHRLVFTTEYRHGGDELLVELLHTAEFTEIGGRTRLDLTVAVTFAVPEAADSLDHLEQGTSEQLEKLEREVAHAAAEARQGKAGAQARPELTIRRVFEARRELVYACWTQQDHMQHWCFPKDFTVPHSQADIREGGRYRSCLRAPDGTDNWVGGVYRELSPPERIVFTHAWQDEAGNADHETVVTVTLEDIGGNRTRMTFHQAFFLSEASRDGHAEGWNETFDYLDGYLARTGASA